jgi:xylan 1,4-beta-xylosidase
VAHCESRYGQERVRTWLWEVWNEWDYSGFWSGGTEQKYYDLYKNAVLGAKGVDPQIKIGGPSTTGSGGLANFVNVCKSNNMEVDLLTNHCYGQSGSTESNPASIRNDNRNRSNAIKNSGKKLLSLNTEYSSSYSGQGGNTSAFCISMDSHVNAPFIAKCVKLILDDHTAGTAQIPDAISYWAISDVFDEGSWYASHSTTLFGQVFGLINQHGIPKAAFNAHRLLHKMGTTRLALTGGTGDNDGVDGFATVDSTNSVVTIMVYNFYKALGGQTAVDNVSLTVNSLPIANGNVEVRHYRIDSLHSNPYSVWLKANKPQSTNTSAMDQIRAAANLAEMYPAKTINYTGGAYTESFELPRQGMSLIVLKGNPTSIASGNQVPRSTPRVSFSNGIVKVASFDADDAATVSVFTTNGRLVRSTQISGQVAIRDLVPVRGIYLVRAKCGSIENASLVRVE